MLYRAQHGCYRRAADHDELAVLEPKPESRVVVKVNAYPSSDGL